jgi:hypothetical protein
MVSRESSGVSRGYSINDCAGRTTTTEHIQNVFGDGELDETMVCRNFRHTTPHGARTPIGFSLLKIKYRNVTNIPRLRSASLASEV